MSRVLILLLIILASCSSPEMEEITIKMRMVDGKPLVRTYDFKKGTLLYIAAYDGVYSLQAATSSYGSETVKYGVIDFEIISIKTIK